MDIIIPGYTTREGFPGGPGETGGMSANRAHNPAILPLLALLALVLPAAGCDCGGAGEQSGQPLTPPVSGTASDPRLDPVSTDPGGVALNSRANVVYFTS